MREYQEYLGDGVYASFDGYQIWLAANHRDNDVIALEPVVFETLVNYARLINDNLETRYFKWQSA